MCFMMPLDKAYIIYDVTLSCIPDRQTSGSEINFFGYSPVGRVAIKLYSPDTKIYSPNVNSKQQHKQALATIINDRTWWSLDDP